MFDTVGNIASIVAAIASVILFFYFVWDRRFRVRIRVMWNLVEIPARTPERMMVSVEVVNVGTRPVAIDKVFVYGPEEKLALMRDSLDRPDAQKLLTPENPSVTFYGPQDDIGPQSLIAVIAYDRTGRLYVHHTKHRRKRVARWFSLRFTKKGRAARKLLIQLKLGRV